MISISNFEPCELGLPESFPSFRHPQTDAIDWICNEPKRFLGGCLPTGSGKSLIAIGASRASGFRTCVLTSTKGLEDQYLRDFRTTGLCDIRGKANYSCADRPNTSCRFGPHEGCRFANHNGCTYEKERDRARQSNLVVTNYAYWIRANEHNRVLEGGDHDDLDSNNPFEMLICDEGHKTMDELARALQVVNLREQWLVKNDIDYDKTCEDIPTWVKWAFTVSGEVDEKVKHARRHHRAKPSSHTRERIYQLEELQESIIRLGSMDSTSWTCEMRQGTTHGRVWDFDCIWPGQYAENRLFLGIPKVVILSATLRPVSLAMLGIKKDDYAYREWPRIFPAHHTPVYHLDTVRMSRKTSDDDLKKWVENIDGIIESRLVRKGIIHTVSYSRQQYLLAHSKFSGHFLCNKSDPDSGTASDVVAMFKETDAPCILVSPSFSTGWDFPDQACEWQIITKVPFPETQSKIMKARTAHNRRYPMYIAMQDLVQACGRGTRSYNDRCEVFIVDNNIDWFVRQNKSLAPGWFSTIPIKSIPPPGKRTNERT